MTDRNLTSIDIVSYAKRCDRRSFGCGKPDLDEWLKTQASQQEQTGNTRTFLAVRLSTEQVVGYYATTTYRLELDEAALAYGAGKRRYPIPAGLLARLAVDERWQGKGLGVRLLMHALAQVARASHSVGFEVLVVHAIDPDAVTFYAQAGFTRFEDHPLHLFMPVTHLRATIEFDY